MKLAHIPLVQIFKRDPEDTGRVVKSSCDTCWWKHQGAITCDAFPDGIPEEILVGAFDHHAPYLRDNGDWDGGLTYYPVPPAVQLAAKSAPSLTIGQNLIQFTQAEAKPAPSFSSVFKANPFHDKMGRFTSKAKAAWSKVGSQKGSNPGGLYEMGGKRYYVKFPHSKGQIYAEQAADQVYDLMGVQSMKHKAQKVNGRTGSVSEWQEVEPLGSEGWTKLDERQVQQAANAFVASALVKNWDVVGLAHDNMGKTKSGDLAILDTGGSFKHRAMGEPKPYNNDPIPEIQGMLDTTKTSGRVFAPLLKAHPEAFKAAAERLKSIPDDDLKAIAGTMRDEALPAAIIGRKASILKYFGVQ